MRSLTICYMMIVMMMTGCATLSTTQPKSPAPAAQTPEIKPSTIVNTNTPARIAAVWKEEVLKANGKRPTRGFVGRIYFYDNNDELLQVDGDLVIYGYDDSDSRAGQIPDHEYRFPAMDFRSHYNSSELGHSYSVWLPWPQTDGTRKPVSLVPVFKTSDGGVIQGNINRLVLSGNAPKNELKVEKTIASNLSERSKFTQPRRRTDTLQVPYSVAQKLAQNPPMNSPSNRVPPKQVLQHLNDMESAQHNPEGNRYNKMHIKQTQNRVPQTNSAAERTTSATTANFSDSVTQTSQMPVSTISSPKNPAPSVQRLSSFGKPGKFR